MTPYYAQLMVLNLLHVVLYSNYMFLSIVLILLLVLQICLIVCTADNQFRIFVFHVIIHVHYLLKAFHIMIEEYFL